MGKREEKMGGDGIGRREMRKRGEKALQWGRDERKEGGKWGREKKKMEGKIRFEGAIEKQMGKLLKEGRGRRDERGGGRE